MQPCGPVAGGLFTWTHIVPTAALAQLLTCPPPLSAYPTREAASCAPASMPPNDRFEAPAMAAASAAVCWRRLSWRITPISIAKPAKPIRTTNAAAVKTNAWPASFLFVIAVSMQLLTASEFGLADLFRVRPNDLNQSEGGF